jgi:hypothetical protein
MRKPEWRYPRLSARSDVASKSETPGSAKLRAPERQTRINAIAKLPAKRKPERRYPRLSARSDVAPKSERPAARSPGRQKGRLELMPSPNCRQSASQNDIIPGHSRAACRRLEKQAAPEAVSFGRALVTLTL